MNHTPERWEAALDDHSIHAVVEGVRVQIFLASCTYFTTDDKNARLNKVLAAQTPLNLARVVECVNGCAGLNPAAYRECVEALKKAEIALRTRKSDRIFHRTVIDAITLAQAQP